MNQQTLIISMAWFFMAAVSRALFRRTQSRLQITAFALLAFIFASTTDSFRHLEALSLVLSAAFGVTLVKVTLEGLPFLLFQRGD